LSHSLLLSDLHLAPERPAGADLFLGFLRNRAPAAAALYILGDLFDAWIGDDDDQPPYPAVRTGLRALVASGTPCFLMRGNRDFLLGRTFARDTGCTLLGDPAVAHVAGVRTLLMHGDLLCTDDRPYQRFRRRVRNPIVQRLFLWQPLPRRRAIAADYRRKSAAAIAAKAQEIMDVNQGTVERFMRRFRVDRLIHGHTHRPADHCFMLRGRSARRIVLADWQGHRGEVLVVTADGWRREEVVPGEEAIGTGLG